MLQACGGKNRGAALVTAGFVRLCSLTAHFPSFCLTPITLVSGA
jgi:hypothetical protein